MGGGWARDGLGAVAGQGRWRGGGVRVEAGTGGLGRFCFSGLGAGGDEVRGCVLAVQGRGSGWGRSSEGSCQR